MMIKRMGEPHRAFQPNEAEGRGGGEEHGGGASIVIWGVGVKVDRSRIMGGR